MFIAIKIITQELDTNSNEVKNLFNNLKITFPNKEYRKMQKLSITLNELKLKENRKKVKILTENNDIQSKVKKLHTTVVIEAKYDEKVTTVPEVKTKTFTGVLEYVQAK